MLHAVDGQLLESSLYTRTQMKASINSIIIVYSLCGGVHIAASVWHNPHIISFDSC